METWNTFNELIDELAIGSIHSREAIEKVLVSFIDPVNSNMQLDEFLELLLDATLPQNENQTRLGQAQNIAVALEGLIENVRQARRFDSKYLGHLLSESSIPALLAHIIAMRIGSNTVTREVSMQETDLEPEAIRYLMQVVGFDPKQGSGTFTSGGTIANMTALWAARKRMPIAYNGNVSYMRVLTTRFAHYSIDKACHLLGGPDEAIQIVRVETKNFRMSPEDLERKISKARQDNVPIMAIVAIAGETETGLIDPLEEIAVIAEKYGLWWMVDGAYGAPYRLSRAEEKFRGMEKAFAITLDPHKALYTPYSNGVVLFKNAEDHAPLAMDIRADYLKFHQQELSGLVEGFRNNEVHLGLKRIEGSMGAGPILSTIAVLRTFGFDGLKVLYDLTLDRTQYLYERLSNSIYLEPVHSPDLNMLCFTLRESSYERLGIRDNGALRNLVEVYQNNLDNGTFGASGYFFSITNLPSDEGEKLWVWRACIMHPRTTNSIIDQAITKLESLIAGAA